jgi:hypothetical protein
VPRGIWNSSVGALGGEPRDAGVNVLGLSRSRSNATKRTGHSSAARAAPAPRRASRFCKTVILLQ